MLLDIPRVKEKLKVINVFFEYRVGHCILTLQTTNEKASIHDRIAFLNEASVMK